MSLRRLLLAALAVPALVGLSPEFLPGAPGLFETDRAEATTPDRQHPASPPIVEPRQPGALLFYFFSPDFRPPDLGKLAVSMEEALAAEDLEISFQAFTRYENFERQLNLQPPHFMMAPAWIEASGKSGPGRHFTVIARPSRREKTTYRKALMARSRIDSIDDLARGSVAATLHSMGAGRPEAVLDAFHLTAGSVRVVPVPKDIDALLALNFGQVDAALVTSDHYEALARTNPGEAEKLRVLAFSPEVGLPPVFASESADPARRVRLGQALARFTDVDQGRRVLAMLGLDGFVAETIPTTTTIEDAEDSEAPEAAGPPGKQPAKDPPPSPAPPSP